MTHKHQMPTLATLCAQGDFLTILNKRNLLLFAFLYFIYAMAGMGISFLVIPLLFLAQPFHSEELGASALYYAPVRPYHLVKGRYLFAYLLLLVLLAMNAILTLLLYFGKADLQFISPQSLLLLLLFYTILISGLLPLFFAKGYRKGLHGLYGTIILFLVLSYLAQEFSWNQNLDAFLTGKAFLPVILILLAAAGIVLLRSYRFSIKAYDHLDH